LPLRHAMIAGEALPPVGKRREFLRAVLGADGAKLVGSQDSSALAALAAADCLIDRPAGSPAVPAGSAIDGFLLQNG
jgi:molybdopterin molybdotransferase